METKRTPMHDFEILEQSLNDMLDHDFIDVECYGSLLPYLKRIKEALEDYENQKLASEIHTRVCESVLNENVRKTKLLRLLESKDHYWSKLHINTDEVRQSYCLTLVDIRPEELKEVCDGLGYNDIMQKEDEE